jgi:integrase
MKSTVQIEPPPRLDFSQYDRRISLDHSERERIAGVAANGDTLHIRLSDPLLRLLKPLRDCLKLTGAQESQHSFLREVVVEMHQRETAFWAWEEDAWVAVYNRCVRTSTANTLQHIMAMAAILCNIDLADLRNRDRKILRRYALSVKVFGRESVDESLDLVMNELKRMGYSGYFHHEVRFTLCELFLSHRTPYARSLTADCLEELRARPVPDCLKQATFMISHALVSLGVMSAPLSPYARKPRKKLLDEHHSLSEEWFSWCKRWFETSTLRPSTRHSHFYRLLVAGRWLRAKHSSVTRPDQWSRQLAAEYIATISQMKVGQFIDDPRQSYMNRPLSASSKVAHILALRCFFSDLMTWEWMTPQFDPRRAFQCPRTISALRTPNPRIIAEDIWAKLLWAGLNLIYEDLPQPKGQNTKRYPLELFRALSLVWLFGGLRSDEIRRLRVGCVRWNTAKQGKPEEQSVCLLEVPANKTGGPYTKPVHRAVGEAIEEWQKVRPATKAIPDEKTGELVDLLFVNRGRPLGRYIINHTIIPVLCRKAGVPEQDAKGSITSHRARSTIATQLYNAKQPMSLFALKEWLGHSRLESTQWYAKVTPDKLTEAYLNARYFERNVAVVQVLLDRAAIESGAATKGETYKYVHLGHGYCANPYWAQCVHRMACQRCEFYVPGESAKAQSLEADTHNLRLLEQIPVTDTERKALEGDHKALQKLIGPVIGSR